MAAPYIGYGIMKLNTLPRARLILRKCTTLTFPAPVCAETPVDIH